MKKIYLTKTTLILTIVFMAFTARAQQTDDLLNMLIKKGVISQKEADSLRADEVRKQQLTRDKENQHGITIGSRALQISGLIQTRYQGFEQSSVNNAFDLHRARLDVKGQINDNWNYEVYTEFAGSTKLLDAYTTYKITDYLKFTAGQFKVPFSLESLIADSQLEFIDRSQVVEALAGRSKDVEGNQNGRDIGIQVNGSFAKIDGRYLFDYTFGVFNGAGYNVTTDNNNHKDIAGRLSVHPVNNLTVSADFYNGLANYGTPPKNEKRDREGIDARYVYGPLSLTAEFDKGTDGTINRTGWYGQAAYFVVRNRLQLVAKYDTYDPTQTLNTDRSTWYIGGVNYFFNEWAKLTVDYSLRREQTTQIANDLFSAQLQLTF